MEVTGAELTKGRHCRLLRPVRDLHGLSHFTEQPRILRELDNLDRHMYLVQFDDGSTAFLPIRSSRRIAAAHCFFGGQSGCPTSAAWGSPSIVRNPGSAVRSPVNATGKEGSKMRTYKDKPLLIALALIAALAMYAGLAR